MRLMVLGGGSCQLNLIRRARAEGDFILLADYLPDCPGRALAHLHLPVSTFDTEGVLRAAAEHGAQAIVTLGTDQPVYAAAVTAQALGLPFYIGPDTALAVTNKRVMKELFRKNGIPHCDYRLLERDFQEEELRGLAFPAVLKPVDSQGQRGIFLVHGPGDIRAHIGETLSFSRESRALLEEFYESDEITVNGWVAEGRLTILTVVDRVTIKGTEHIGVCLCHHFPSLHLPDRGAEIKALTGHITACLGIRNGPVYFQYLVGEKGIRVNEIAMRIGGAYEDLTLPRITGVDITGLLLQTVRYGRCDASVLEGYSMERVQRFLSTQMFFCHPGKIRSLPPPEQLMELPGVVEGAYAVRPGDTVGSMENATARAGYFLVEGGSFSQMLGRVNALFDNLLIEDEAGKSLVLKYRDYPDRYVIAREPEPSPG